MGTTVFASNSNVNIQPKYDNNTFIIIKGEENIRAYEEAGLVRKAPKTSNISPQLEVGTQGTTIPTSTWDLNDKSRSFTYSFKNYIYSEYKYLPCPDSLGSTGYGIYHTFNPDSSQKIKLSFYNDDGFEFSTEYDIDDITLTGIAVENKAYYIKYISKDQVKISGSGDVY